jgi:serine/threonine protein kinase
VSSSAVDSTPRQAGVSGDRPVAPDVPDFHLIRPIGRGGFGEVWLATNRTTGRLRAVKVIPLKQPDAADPARREITSLARLEGSVRAGRPHLATIHHVGKTAELLFYVMDPADDISGSAASSEPGYRPATLRSRLKAETPTPEECFSLARQLLAGLASLHEAGMVHRDVKPGNCLFIEGELKLADFGLVTAADLPTSRVGTQKYMPPDGRMDTRADVYAAGLVIYEMITGLPADRFPRLGERGRDVVENPILNRLNRLVLRACQPDPGERFQDAGQMLAELTRPEQPLLARRARRRRRMVAAAACVAAVVLLGASPLWWDHMPWRRPRSVDVNFITRPFDATIYLDGALQTDDKGLPYLTPCTIPHLTPRVHRVEFESENGDRWDAGPVDFASNREIEARWDAGESGPPGAGP